MCILTYIPQKNEALFITHSRDENILRPAAIPPSFYQIENQNVIFPKDPQGGGTWFAQSKDWVLCLLNGAYEDHITKPQYRASRGTIITDFFQNPNFDEFQFRFNAQGLEPFTLVLFDINNSKIHQLIWDEKVLNIQHFDSQKPYIWLSSTLYDASLKKSKTDVFYRFIQSKNDILDFHKTHSFKHSEHEGTKRIIKNIHTVSISQVVKSGDKIKFSYVEDGIN